LLTMNKVV